MIERLTKKKQEQLPVCIDKWHKLFISTEQYSDGEIIDSVNKLYKSLNKPIPQIVILDSPVQCHQYIQDNKITLYNSISYSFCNVIKHSVKGFVADSVSDSIWTYLNNSIWYAVRDTFPYFIRDFIWIYVRNSILINYWAKTVNMRALRPYKPFLNISEKVFFALLEDNIVIICRKLKTLHLDDNNRLHSDGVNAFEFNDGYGEYFNHGLHMPLTMEHCKSQLALEELSTNSN